MNTLLNDSFIQYAQYLNQRIDDSQHITEDSVRYSFFAALIESTNIKQNEIVLELPHPYYEGKEIDTFIRGFGERPDMYFEFKFHRATRSTSPKPHKAGSLFKDFNRLRAIESPFSSYFVIYVTCPEMADYFQNNKGDYSNFWATQAGNKFIFDDGFLLKTTDTFKKASGDLYPSHIHVEYACRLSNEYQLRIYKVLPI